MSDKYFWDVAYLKMSSTVHLTKEFCYRLLGCKWLSIRIYLEGMRVLASSFAIEKFNAILVLDFCLWPGFGRTGFRILFLSPIFWNIMMTCIVRVCLHLLNWVLLYGSSLFENTSFIYYLVLWYPFFSYIFSFWYLW